jgi:hypothetical protein
MGRLAAEIVAGLPAKARQAGRIGEAAEDAARLHLDKANLGLRVMEQSGVILSAPAATELVKRMERLGITSVDEIIQVADGLEDRLPCRIVGGGQLRSPMTMAKPPCAAWQIGSVFNQIAAQARSMGVIREVEVRGFIRSAAGGPPPGQVLKEKFSPEEHQHALEIVSQKGGTIVGPWRTSQPGIDGFYNGRPLQLKMTDSNRPIAVLEDVKYTIRHASGYSGLSLFIRAPNVDRDQLVDFARNGPLVTLTQGPTIHSVDVLVSGGQWVHIEGGLVN